MSVNESCRETTIMRKIGILLCILSLATATALRAAEVIEVEKFTKEQFAQALKAASDDTPIEYRGQTKTKAGWRSFFQAKADAFAARVRQQQGEHKVRVEAAAKALKDKQDQEIAVENAEVAKEFEQLKALGGN
jgi:hypothetical protein